LGGPADASEWKEEAGRRRKRWEGGGRGRKEEEAKL